MEFLEKDLEEIIYTSNREKLEGKGLFIEGIVKRQLRIGKYGVADLVGFKKEYDCYRVGGKLKTQPYFIITVYELKRDKIGVDAFMQAIRYIKGIQRYIELRGYNISDMEYNITLIGRSLDKDYGFPYLTDVIPSSRRGVEFLSLYTYNYGIDGIEFNPEYDYKLIEEEF